jgi:hypothetical protein
LIGKERLHRQSLWGEAAVAERVAEAVRRWLNHLLPSLSWDTDKGVTVMEILVRRLFAVVMGIPIGWMSLPWGYR